MKECQHCGIQVGGQTKKCPFCQNSLVGDATENMWPSPVGLKSKSIIYKIQLFVVFTVIVLALAADFLFHVEFLNIHWSLLITMWLVVFEYGLMRLFRKEYSPARILSLFGATVLIMLMITSYFTYFFEEVASIVVPSVVMGTMIANFVLAMINSQISNSLVYLLSNIVIGILPYIVLFGMGRSIPMFWIFTLVLSVILFIGACIFRGREVIGELQKRFNI